MCVCVCVCSHYFVNGGWFEEDNHILNRVDIIRHIPATIVQGRYDLITPMKTAWELHKVHVIITTYTINTQYTVEPFPLI